jgi:hypothetical protein
MNASGIKLIVPITNISSIKTSYQKKQITSAVILDISNKIQADPGFFQLK